LLNGKQPVFDLVIKGTKHQNYCEAHLIASKYLLTRLPVLGRDHDPYLVMRTLDNVIAAFFLTHDMKRVKHDENDLKRMGSTLINYLSKAFSLKGNTRSSSSDKQATVKKLSNALSALSETASSVTFENKEIEFIVNHFHHESIVFHDVPLS
jgi:hypothetical protein